MRRADNTAACRTDEHLKLLQISHRSSITMQYHRTELLSVSTAMKVETSKTP